MAEQLLSHVKIKIGGAKPPAEFLSGLLSITVEQSLVMPNMCVIHVRDPEVTFTNSDQFKPGTPVQIEAEYLGESGELFKGEVASIEPEFGELGPTLRLRAYDKSHRLHRGRKIRTWQNVKDSDVAQQVASECGLSPDVDSTSGLHEYVIQLNQTNMEFLHMLARRSGARVYVDGEKLAFKLPGSSSGGTVRLEWGIDLLHFRARISPVEQVSEYEARGYDPVKKEEVIGKAQNGRLRPSIGVSQPGGSYASSAFGGQAKGSVVHQHLDKPALLDALAQSLQDELESGFIQAEGLCMGKPKLKAGCKVQLKGVGSRFNGSYEVTTATHTYTPRDGYRTSFVISGKRPTSLLDTVGARPESGALQLVVGVVTDNKDPEELGRVKVKFPAMADSEQSWWLRLASPMAGPQRGLFILPEVNDEVLVGFHRGDPHHGYVIGSLWNGKDKPPLTTGEALSNGKVKQRVFKTAQDSHSLLFDDSPDKPGITLKTKAGHTVHLDDSGSGKIVITDKGGNELSVDSGQNKLSVTMKGNMEVKTQGNVEIDSTGQIKISSKAGMELSAAGPLKIDGKATVDIQAGAILTLKGSMVKIN